MEKVTITDKRTITALLRRVGHSDLAPAVKRGRISGVTGGDVDIELWPVEGTAWKLKDTIDPSRGSARIREDGSIIISIKSR